VKTRLLIALSFIAVSVFAQTQVAQAQKFLSRRWATIWKITSRLRSVKQKLSLTIVATNPRRILF